MTVPIRISSTAAALHPALPDAIRAAGGTVASGDSDIVADGGNGTRFGIFSDIEESERPGVIVRRAARAGLVRPDGQPPRLAFAAADLRFAAAVIVALAARDDAPAAADPGAIALHALAARVAARDVSVLVTGPTGTGKEVLARFIHARSPRRDFPLVAVNCAALPEAMLEALLFGHERGAFTGAATAARGLFRAADGGTLLLDEIAELPLGLQAKLLRVLQEREVLPIGATVAHPVDVRIIATANRDLAAEVAAGRFRSDLYYRLAVFPLATTSLATRPADIVPVAAALWLRHGGEAWPTPAALAALEAHAWPGNVRELSNVLQRAAVLGDGRTIERRDIVFDAPPLAIAPVASLVGQVREREFAVIRRALDDCNGRRVDTARRLGISERTLRYKLAAMAGAPRFAGSALQ